MKKKIISLLMVFLIAFACGARIEKPEKIINAEANKEETKVEDDLGYGEHELEVVRANYALSSEQITSKIKADYLLQNNGYSDSDEIVVILSFAEPSLIDTLNEENSSLSVSEYAQTSQGKSQLARINAQQKTMINRLTTAGLIDSVEYTYTTVMNGIAVNTTYGNLEALEKRADIKNVMMSETYAQPKVIDDASAIENAVDIYEDTGIFRPSGVDYTGKGTSVAVLDSGFDCSHSVYNNPNFDNSDLMYTRSDIQAFISGANGQMNAATTTADLEIGDVYYSDKIPFVYDYADKDPDVFPYDSEHGTHVAGIIGGDDDVITGVAVNTQLVLMKVFADLKVGAKKEDIVAALEDAVILGVDAINLSLGVSCGFSREEDEEGVNEVYAALNSRGISILAAASNDHSSAYGGDLGNTNKATNPDSGTVGSPSTYPTSLSVASISGTKSKYLVANDKQVIFFNESNSITGDENKFFEELYEDLGKTHDKIVEMEYVTIPGVGKQVNYTAFEPGYLNGKIALVRRGDNTFEDKALQAKRAGAAACIIYNNIEGDILMSMGKTDHIPTISISKEDGEELAKLDVGKIVLDFSNQAGPFMSDFSSWGPTGSLNLKPEITAHGGNIKSSVPGGGYDELSGTSMATPNLCGVMVLIKQYLKEEYPDLGPVGWNTMANQLLMSTATIILNEQGNPYSPRKQGAGLTSLLSAVTTKAYLTVDGIDKAKIELFDDPKRTGVYEMEFNVVNLSNTNLSYDLSVIGMTESVSTSDDEFVSEKSQLLNGNSAYEAISNASISGNTITVNANSTAKVKVTYTLTQGDKDLIDTLFSNGMYVEGFVKLTSKDTDGINLNIPFLAFYGDWTEAPMFDKTYYEVDADAKNGAIDEEDKVKADYIATTPYGTYYHNYIIPLGTYIYKVDTSKYDEIPASEEHISISNIFGNVDGIYGIYAGLLRNAKTVNYTITDTVTGEVVYEHIDYNAIKAHFGGAAYPYLDELDLRAIDYGFTNNRIYHFKMEAKLDYGDGGVANNERNTFEFDFTMDTEAPIIKSATYEKEYDKSLKKDRFYLNLEVYDNHYVQNIAPVTFSEDRTGRYLYTYSNMIEYPIPVYGEKGANTKVRIEITEFLDDLGYDFLTSGALSFNVMDYALNNDIFICQLPGLKPESDRGFKFTKDGQDGNRIYSLSVYENEIIDLTEYLYSDDPNLDADKDFLKYMDWSSSNDTIVEAKLGEIICKKPGMATVYASTININSQGQPISIYTSIDIEVLPEEDGKSTERGLVSHVGESRIKEIEFSHFDTLFAYPIAAQSSYIGSTGDKVYVDAVPAIEFYPGEKIQLQYNVTPWYVEDDYKITYSVGNDLIAEVDPETGVVYAKKEGSTIVSLSVEGSNVNARIRVTVRNPFVIENRQLIAYKGLDEEVIIPDDEGILYINSYAFCLYETDIEVEVDEDDYDANKTPEGNKSIKKIVVPNGVMYIEKYAFYKCENLVELVIPDTVRFIRGYACYECKNLEKVTLLGAKGADGKYTTVKDKDGNEVCGLKNVEAIGALCFAKCEKLNNVDLEETYSLGMQSFYGCTSLDSIDLTALRNAAYGVFMGCSSLKNVTLGQNTKLSSSMFLNTAIEEITIYEREQIPNNCFSGCKSLTKVEIMNDLTYIGDSAFSGCSSLTEFVSKKVANIGNYAFSSCAFTEFTLPNGEVSFGNNVFSSNNNLTKVIFSVDTKIAGSLNNVFSGAKISTFVTEGSNHYSVDGNFLVNKAGNTIILANPSINYGDLTIDAKYTEIGESAFSGMNISSLTITNKDLVIGKYAFAGCNNIETINFPTEAGFVIPASAFANLSHLTTVTNLDKVAKIGDSAFYRTGISEIVIGTDAKIGEKAFASSSVTTVTLGENVTVGVSAFESSSVTTVNMPSEASITLGEKAFYNCENLETIDLSKVVGKIANYAFYNCKSLVVADLENVTEVGDSAFMKCSNLTSVSMPNVTKIGDSAFGIFFKDPYYDEDEEEWVEPEQTVEWDAPQITELVLPNIEEIGRKAFFGCFYLERVDFTGSSITLIDDRVFSNCSALEEVVLTENITKIGEYAFFSCASLTTINTGSLEIIGNYAFTSSQAEATPIENLDLSSAVEIGEFAFAGQTEESGNANLNGEIVAPNLVKIGQYAFQYSSIEKFTAPIVEYIGDGAFFYVDTMTEFNIPETLNYLGRAVFVKCPIENFTFGNGETTGKVNDYVSIEDGVIYTVTKNGIQLKAVPAGKEIDTLTVKEGTVRVDMYAGNENTTVRKIVLPDGLKSLGHYAFYGYTGLKGVEFKSVVAPTLESQFVDLVMTEQAPGFDLLHPNYSMYNYELCYMTFVGLVGTLSVPKGQDAALVLTLPSNADVTGYDTLVYEAYFGKVENAIRSDYTAMEESMVKFLEYAKEICKIEILTLSHEKIINDAIARYNAIKQDYRDFGIADEEWNNYVETVTKAKADVTKLKVSKAGRMVEELYYTLTSLPTTFTIDCLDTLRELTAKLDAMEKDEKQIFDLTNYNALVKSYEEYLSKIDTEIKPIAKDLANSVAGVVSTVTATLTLAGVAFAIIKKRWFM